MKTKNILLREAASAKTIDRAERVEAVAELARLAGKIDRVDFLHVARIISNNQDVNADYWKQIDEFEEARLRSSGRIY